MLQIGLTFLDLEHMSGLKHGTIHNILSGFSSSKRARQAITNALQTKLWPDIEITDRRVTLPAGLEIEFNTEAEAIAAEKEFFGFIARTGAKLLFIKPTNATIGDSNTTNLSERRAAKRTPLSQKTTASESAAAAIAPTNELRSGNRSQNEGQC